MAQPSSHEQLSIQEVPNILKIARQNAAVGLYLDSLRSFRHALHVIVEHIKTLKDPFLKEQWKKTNDEVRGEVEGICNLYNALKGLRGLPTGSTKDEVAPPSDPDERPLNKVTPAAPAAPMEPKHHKQSKPPPSVLERFGCAPFSKVEDPSIDQQQPPMFGKDYRRDEQPPIHLYQNGPSNQEHKKDPLVWDPPSPKHFKPAKQPKPKNLPNWAKAKPGSGPGAGAKHGGKPQAYF